MNRLGEILEALTVPTTLLVLSAMLWTLSAISRDVSAIRQQVEQQAGGR